MKTNNSYADILNMPYIALLCISHYIQEIDEESYRMKSGKLSSNKSNNSTVKKHQTEPDWNAIRKTGGVI